MNKFSIATIAVICLLGGLYTAMQQSDGTPVSFQANANGVASDFPKAVDTEGALNVDSVQSENVSASVEEGDDKTYDTPEPNLTEVDRPLPSFTLGSLDNTQWNADTLAGKPWVINFWATWCPPCIEELPSMNAAYEVLEPEGVGMLAINAGEGSDAVAVFLQKVAIDFPNVLGNGNTLPNWSVRALPTTIVVDALGNVVFEAIGPREWDDPRLLDRVLGLL